MRLVAVTLSAAVTLAWCTTVCAETKEDEARAVFEKGKQLFIAEKYSEAAAAFREAHKLKPHWKLFYNMGQSEVAAKQYGLALETFERYLAEGGDGIDTDRRDEVLSQIERLRKTVGALDIQAPGGSIITVDDVERGRTPLSGHLLVAAGVEHQVLVTHSGERTIDRTVRVTGGQTLVIEVEEQVNELRVVGWITIGVGGALIVGGAITGGMALSRNRELEDGCDNGVCPAGYDLGTEDERDKLALVTDILIPTGGVIVAAGIVMLIVDATAGKSDESESVARLRPVAGGNVAGLVLEGRF